MGEKKDLYVRFDWAIKRLLRQKANFGVLEGFLTVFLGERIRIVEILESESNQEGPDEKYNRVDIKALDSKGEIVIIEVQNTRELNFMERLLFGTSKAVTEHIDKGQKYSNVKKVYSISIVYFNIGEGSDYLYHGQTRFIGVHTHDELLMHEKDRDALVPVPELAAKTFPEYYIIRVNEFDRVAVTPMEEWMRYLKDGVIEPDTTAPGLQEARQRLQYYSMTKEEQRSYLDHMDFVNQMDDAMAANRREGREEGLQEGLERGRKEGLKEGLEKGLAQGREEERLRTARAMMAKGYRPEEIAELMSMDINTLRQL